LPDITLVSGRFLARRWLAIIGHNRGHAQGVNFGLFVRAGSLGPSGLWHVVSDPRTLASEANTWPIVVCAANGAAIAITPAATTTAVFDFAALVTRLFKHSSPLKQEARPQPCS